MTEGHAGVPGGFHGEGGKMSLPVCWKWMAVNTGKMMAESKSTLASMCGRRCDTGSVSCTECVV